MAERIDTLYGEVIGAPGFPSTYNSVTVNNAVNLVAIDTVAVAWDWTFVRPTTGAQVFAARDNIRVLSYGLMMPHGLALANSGIAAAFAGFGGETGIDLTASLNGAAPIPLTAFQDLLVPWGDYEIALDVFSDWAPLAPALATDALRLHARIRTGWVSMVGVNAALNGLTLYPIPYVKVLHTNPLT